MDAQQIITEINHLPLHERRQILKAIDVKENEMTTEEQTEQRVLQILLAEGIITEIPPRWNEDDDDDDFEPIELEGEPLSEMIIRERR